MPERRKTQTQRPAPRMGGNAVKHPTSRPPPPMRGPNVGRPQPARPLQPIYPGANTRPNYPPGPMPPNRGPVPPIYQRPGSGQPQPNGGVKAFYSPAPYAPAFSGGQRSMGSGRQVSGPVYPSQPGGQLRAVPGGIPRSPVRPPMGASGGAPQMPFGTGARQSLPIQPQPLPPDQYMTQFTDPRDIYKAQFENRARWATGSLTPEAQQYVLSTPFYTVPQNVTSHYSPGINTVSLNNASPYLMQHEYSHGLGWPFPSGFDVALQQQFGDGRDPVEWYAFMATQPSLIPPNLRQFFPQFKPSVYGP